MILGFGNVKVIGDLIREVLVEGFDWSRLEKGWEETLWI